VSGVVVLSPDPRTTVAPPVDVVLVADDRAPDGMSVRLTLDGRPLDRATGELGGATASPFPMAPGDRRRIRVVDVGAGAHTLTVEVSASEGARSESIDVPFSVSGEGSGSEVIYLGILLALIAVAFFGTRRRMRSRRTGSGIRAQADPPTSRKD
jgi:hypothetical protein